MESIGHSSYIRRVKALGLCSGGLDSILAALMLREQGVEVRWIAFETPFFSAAKAKRASINHQIPLIVKDITERYLPMLNNPPCGYGQHMNPCLDCHALMFRIAGERLAETESDFLFSGEVMGQRPMSQRKNALRYVEKHSGFDGLILRPLSAKLLPETRMEQEGLVDRARLGDISGRGRKAQMELAEKWGVKDYPSPGGGCLLTDGGYANRLRDLLEHPTNKDWERQDFDFLRYGRHFRLNGGIKLIVGRHRQDNEALLQIYRPGHDTLLQVRSLPGPVGIVPGGGGGDDIIRAAGICAGYTKTSVNQTAVVRVTMPEGMVDMTIAPIPSEAVKELLIS